MKFPRFDSSRLKVPCFLILQVMIFFVYNFQDYVFLRPSGQHQWRQTDSGSLALNYHQYGYGFFQPETHRQYVNNGKSVGELPLINYLVAKLYDVFGFKEYLFRLLNYLFFVAGVVCFYLLIYEIFKDLVLALFSVVLLSGSGIVNFYSISFMPDAPGFAMSLVSLYFMYRLMSRGGWVDFLLAVLSATLTILLKPSHMIPFVSVVGISLFAILFKDDSKEGRLLRGFRDARSWLFLLVPMVGAAWVKYAHDYRAANDNDYFLQRLMPIWTASDETKKFIRDRMLSDWGWWPDLHVPLLLYLLPLMLIVFFLMKSRLTRLWFLIYLLGCLFYVILFGKQFDHHDYYLMPMALMIPVAVLGVIHVLWTRLAWDGMRTFTYGCLLGLSVYILAYNADRMKVRFVDFHWDNKFDALFDAERKLDEVGVALDDLVYVCKDNSHQISLYLMNRKGWMEAHFDEGSVGRARSKSAKYLFVVHDLNQEKVYPEGFDVPLLTSIENVDVFKL